MSDTAQFMSNSDWYKLHFHRTSTIFLFHIFWKNYDMLQSIHPIQDGGGQKAPIVQVFLLQFPQI